ncbi:hypothetical protein TWF694_007761 [Orbilia ellipsospora]|uniref:Peptidase S8/S53 domain-containing protein n=1 Tax=Orbilia ellipsospora TaxID=2528407 RepID=A0AAV9XIS2_9PEZI
MVVVFLKKAYWKDSEKIQEVESAFEKILDPTQPFTDVWAANYKGIGTPFILIRGKYASIGNFIQKDSKAAAPEAIQYLSGWTVLEALELLSHRMVHYDIKQYPEINVPSEQKRGLQKSRKDKYQQNVTTNESEKGFQSKVVQKRTALPLYGDRDFLSQDMLMYSLPVDPGDDHVYNPPPFYDDSEGENIDIFVVDSGLADHADQLQTFKHAYQNNQIKGWLFPGGPLATTERREHRGEDEEEGGYPFHGTEMISKIIDENVGYARKANIWVGANYDQDDGDYDIYLLDLLFQVLEKIDDETARNPRFKAIINISCVFRIHRLGDVLNDYPDTVLTKQDKQYVQAYSELLDVLFDLLGERKNVIMVTVTGNGALASFVKVYGLSEGIAVPAFEVLPGGEQIPLEPPDYYDVDGASYVAPIVCSILATHLSANPKWSIKRVIDRLYSDAYWKGGRDEELRLVWTGIPDPTDTYLGSDSDYLDDPMDDCDSVYLGSDSDYLDDPTDIEKRAPNHRNDTKRRGRYCQTPTKNKQNKNINTAGGSFLSTKTVALIVTHWTTLKTTLETITAIKTATITKQVDVTNTVIISKTV